MPSDEPLLPMDGLNSYRTSDGRIVVVPKRGGPKGGKHYVERRGYAMPPGTGPAGETCGSCKHHVVNRLARDYHKCILNRAKWTGGPRSDILVRAAACSKWEKA